MKLFQDRFLPFLILIHLLFFIYKIAFGNFFVAIDSIEYLEMAHNIRDFFEFYAGDLSKPINPELYTKRPPLYSLFIVLTSFFLQSKTLVLITQNILSIASIYIIKRIFENTYGKCSSLILFLFTLTAISNFIYANLLMSEILFQFLIVLLIYTIHSFLKKKTLKSLIIYQVILILLLLTKPVFYLFILPNIILTYILVRKTQIRFGILTSLFPICIVVLYSFWNYNRTESYDYSSIQHINLRDYNLKFFHIYKYGSDHAYAINKAIRIEGDEQNSYKEKVNFIKKTSLTHIQKDWLSFIPFHAMGVLKFFVDPGRYDLVIFFEAPNKINEVGFLRHLNEGGIAGAFSFLITQPIFIITLLFFTLIFNLLKLLGFIWFWIKNYKKTPFVYWVMLLIILYIAGITGPIGASRFMIPILPLYLLFSIYGMTDLLKKTKNYWTNTSFTLPSS